MEEDVLLVTEMNSDTTVVGPRIVNGILKWREGDTFCIKWKITLSKDGIPKEYKEGDQFIVSFYKNKSDRAVYSFICSDIGTSNTIFLEFNNKITQFFKAGFYSYCLKYSTTEDGEPKILTIGAKYPVEVERCHW